jgi:hypothetical protein
VIQKVVLSDPLTAIISWALGEPPWQVRGIDHKTFWGPLPDDVRGRFHLYNAPVAENDCPASPQGRFTEKLGDFRTISHKSAWVVWISPKTGWFKNA